MAKVSKDWIDVYLEHGIDRQNRRIFLFDDIEENSIGIVIKGLYYMDSESQDKPIELFIGSFGGGEYQMFALYDVIRTLKSPIHTTAIGSCMSAAPLLVACGEKGYRYATPNTWFMIHQSWDSFIEKRIDEVKKDIEHHDKMAERWYELMALHTNQNADFWRTYTEQVGDHFFDAEQAQKLGIIDHIWDEKYDGTN